MILFISDLYVLDFQIKLNGSVMILATPGSNSDGCNLYDEFYLEHFAKLCCTIEDKQYCRAPRPVPLK